MYLFPGTTDPARGASPFKPFALNLWHAPHKRKVHGLALQVKCAPLRKKALLLQNWSNSEQWNHPTSPALQHAAGIIIQCHPAQGFQDALSSEIDVGLTLPTSSSPFLFFQNHPALDLAQLLGEECLLSGPRLSEHLLVTQT
eukprot:417384-Pelagomonas_calceolata.AAC.6